MRLNINQLKNIFYNFLIMYLGQKEAEVKEDLIDLNETEECAPSSSITKGKKNLYALVLNITL